MSLSAMSVELSTTRAPLANVSMVGATQAAVALERLAVGLVAPDRERPSARWRLRSSPRVGRCRARASAAMRASTRPRRSALRSAESGATTMTCWCGAGQQVVERLDDGFRSDIVIDGLVDLERRIGVGYWHADQEVVDVSGDEVDVLNRVATVELGLRCAAVTAHDSVELVLVESKPSGTLELQCQRLERCPRLVGFAAHRDGRRVEPADDAIVVGVGADERRKPSRDVVGRAVWRSCRKPTRPTCCCGAYDDRVVDEKRCRAERSKCHRSSRRGRPAPSPPASTNVPKAGSTPGLGCRRALPGSRTGHVSPTRPRRRRCHRRPSMPRCRVGTRCRRTGATAPVSSTRSPASVPIGLAILVAGAGEHHRLDRLADPTCERLIALPPFVEHDALLLVHLGRVQRRRREPFAQHVEARRQVGRVRSSAR